MARTVLVTHQWTLDGPDGCARIDCEIALVSDDEDRGLYEIRITLNGAAVYVRAWDSHEDVRNDADAASLELFQIGWQGAERQRHSV